MREYESERESWVCLPRLCIDHDEEIPSETFIQAKSEEGSGGCRQVRCGRSGINDEKNVDTAVSTRRVAVI